MTTNCHVVKLCGYTIHPHSEFKTHTIAIIDTNSQKKFLT